MIFMNSWHACWSNTLINMLASLGIMVVVFHSWHDHFEYRNESLVKHRTRQIQTSFPATLCFPLFSLSLALQRYCASPLFSLSLYIYIYIYIYIYSLSLSIYIYISSLSLSIYLSPFAYQSFNTLPWTSFYHSFSYQFIWL